MGCRSRRKHHQLGPQHQRPRSVRAGYALREKVCRSRTEYEYALKICSKHYGYRRLLLSVLRANLC